MAENVLAMIVHGPLSAVSSYSLLESASTLSNDRTLAQGGAAEGTEELAVMEEVGAQHPGQGEDPLRMADRLEHPLAEERAEASGSLGRARWAQAATLAGECDHQLGWAATALEPGEASLEHSAVEVACDGVVCQAAPEAVAALEACAVLVER